MYVVEISSGRKGKVIHQEIVGSSEPLMIVQFQDGSVGKLMARYCEVIKIMSDKYKFVEKMTESELKTRIDTTGNPSFKKALEAELATRSVMPEASQKPVETISEEVDTNVPVEVKEAPVASKTTTRSRTKTTK